MNLKFQLLKTLVTLRNAAFWEEIPVNKGFKHPYLMLPKPQESGQFPVTVAGSDGRCNTLPSVDPTTLTLESRSVWLYSVKI